jgi:hypothetical protein
MMPECSKSEKTLLVGDNPFHSISHLSQDRTRLRGEKVILPEHAADLIGYAVDSGANGFMFSVSETTISILKALRSRNFIDRLCLYPIVPYAYEYIQLSTQTGGILGLVKNVSKRLARSGDLKTIAMGLRGSLTVDPVSFMNTYLAYEINRVKSSAGKIAKIESVVLHEVITDLALAMNLDWLFKSYVRRLRKLGFIPGFNTCNFAYMIEKFRNWDIELSGLTLVSPFNPTGFQMAPCREKCEEALESLPEPIVITISVLAAGYLSPSQAAKYIAALPNIKGVAIGVSKETHARDTFNLFSRKLNHPSLN